MQTYFLSYARLDQETALRFADDLIAAGFSVWVDQYNILPSQHWDQAVETAVRSCEGMIVILSPNSTASPNVADEVAVAIESGKSVVPVLIEPCTLPLRMTRMQFIDATRDYETALRRCVNHLQASESGPPRDKSRLPLPLETRLDPQMIREPQRRLTSFIGPIAAHLTAEAALHSADKAELYERLAHSIRSEAERRSFLSWLTDPKPAVRAALSGAAQTVSDANNVDTISDVELQRIVHALARHIGPIAPKIVERERASAQSRRDLYLRLGQRIAQERDRAVFLNEVEGG